MARCTFARLVSQRLSRFAHRGERGQVLMMSVLLLPILLGMTGMAIDLGSYADHRRSLQNAADSAALAGARELPDKTAAETAAYKWGANNNVSASDMTVTVTAVDSTHPNPLVSVHINTNHDFSFIRVLGVGSSDVGAQATAMKTTAGGAGSLVPWGVLQTTWASAVPGTSLTLKYDANNPTSGNFGAVRLDGSGSAIYEKTIDGGSTSYVCASGTAGCTDTSPVCAISVCPTETGNKVGATRDGVDWRMTNTDAHCDSFGEVFSGPVSGKYTLNASCNPWLSGSYASHRVIIVPIINSLCNGSCNVTIVNFGMFWLEGYPGGKCTGNSCEITGQFVKADANINALAGTYNASAGLAFTRLSQ